MWWMACVVSVSIQRHPSLNNCTGGSGLTHSRLTSHTAARASVGVEGAGLPLPHRRGCVVGRSEAALMGTFQRPTTCHLSERLKLSSMEALEPGEGF